VLIVTIDTLRADRLGVAGYGRDTTPNLDRFAEEAVRFTRSYSHAPFTAPSHASLFTSLHTPSHGVRTWGDELAPDARTVAERFSEGGWRTGAFYNHPGLTSSGVLRGFDHVDLNVFGPAEASVEELLAWIDEGEGPFTAWLHLWDVHRPYGYRRWDQDWMPDDWRGRPELPFAERRFGEPPGDDPVIGRSEADYNLSRERRDPAVRQDRWGRGPLGPPELRYIADRYDGGVWYADRGLGRLFEALRARGLWDDLVLVVTSDHGEALLERESCLFTHDPFLTEETLRVPLLLRLPGGAHAGEVIDELVRGVDVLPTLLELADLPGDGLEQGASLLPLVQGVEGAGGRWLFAQTQTRSAKERSAKIEAAVGEGPTWLEWRELLADGRWKLVHDIGEGTFALYDLETDPGERHDLAALTEHAERLEEMRGRLADLRASLPAHYSDGRELGDDERELLEGIGYVASGDEDEPDAGE
jgi:arylsulfatase